MGRKSQKPRGTGNRHADQRSSARDYRKHEARCQDGSEAETDSSVKSTRFAKDDSMEMDAAEESVLPRRLIWLVFAWTLVSRLWYVTTPENWWILHPDEVYQTIEVAHTEAFGYGFKPYEYLPPPGNITFSSEQMSANKLGMYSLRSFLLVKVISMVMLVVDKCGVSSSPFLVIKVFHAVVTSCLPLAVFRFTRALYRSCDIATMAAIFTSMSFTLSLLGTHTLINSFVSPCVFVSLVPLVRVLGDSRTDAENSTVAPTQYSPDHVHQLHTENTMYISGDGINANGKTEKIHCFANGRAYTNGDVRKVNGHVNGFLGEFNRTQTDKESSYSYYDLLSDIFKFSQGRKPKLESCSHFSSMLHERNKDINANIIDKQCNGINTYSKDMPDSANINQSTRSLRNCINLDIELNNVLHGLLLGMCIYIRTDTSAIPAVICLLFINDIWRNILNVTRGIFQYAVGVAFGLIIGGYVDHLSYGVWFISVKQWFKFNIWHGSSAIFGESPNCFYVSQLFNVAPFGALLCSIVLLDIIISYVAHVKCKSKLHETSLCKNSTFAVFILLFIYSSIGHKELRFFHNGIVIFYVSLARATYKLCRYYVMFTKNQIQYQYYGRIVWLILILLFSSHVYCFINMDTATISKLSFEGTVDADANMCLDYIRRQSDVKGVFMDRSIFHVGGYSVLHKDVPVFVLQKYDFMEYKKKAGLKDSQRFSHNIGSGISIFDQISDFIYLFNVPYVLKVLIETPQYNYIVLRNDWNFLEVGYREVFRTSKSIVLKRSTLKEDEDKLADIAKSTSLGNNATLLEYEGDWLRHFGLYKQAQKRLRQAIRINNKRIGPFQVLLKISKLVKPVESVDSYKSVLRSCVAVHNKKECLEPYVPIKLR